MPLCLVALLVFSVMSLGSAKYRPLAKQTFKCVMKTLTLSPCDMEIEQRVKAASSSLEETLRSLQKNLSDKDVALKDKDAEVLKLSRERNNLVNQVVQADESRKSAETKLTALEGQNQELNTGLPQKLSAAKLPLEQEIAGLKEQVKKIEVIYKQVRD